ncbi:MAG: uncharacterized protein QOF51_3079 [Chloroflexota bacterium]|nr:uncharacterized protein [Chloroflexota bacterium]
MRKIDLLHNLQEIDSQSDAAQAQIAKLTAEIGERRAVDDRARQVGAARTAVRALQTQQQDLELQAEQHRAKIAADEGKLYGGSVRIAKELENLSHEVAQDKRQLNTVEDELLGVLDQLERATNRQKELETAYVREQRAWLAAQEQAKARLAAAQRAVETLQAQRSSAAQAVDAAARSTYDTLRRQKGGSAVATVHQRTCQACRVTLTPNEEQRARIGNDLVTCNSCGRIFYVPLG